WWTACACGPQTGSLRASIKREPPRRTYARDSGLGGGARDWSTGCVDNLRYTLSPVRSATPRSASRRIHSTSRAKAGSKYAIAGSATPTPGVITDWWAPPSGARLTPEGVATTPNFAPEPTAGQARSSPRGPKDP